LGTSGENDSGSNSSDDEDNEVNHVSVDTINGVRKRKGSFDTL